MRIFRLTRRQLTLETTHRMINNQKAVSSRVSTTVIFRAVVPVRSRSGGQRVHRPFAPYQRVAEPLLLIGRDIAEKLSFGGRESQWRRPAYRHFFPRRCAR